jgi:hypothetical protein
MKNHQLRIKPFCSKNISLIFSFIVVFIFGISNSITAQKIEGIKEVIQEFFIGETVYCQKKNEVQLTSKPAYWKKAGLTIASVPLQFEYGITDRLQIEMNFPYYFIHPKNEKAVKGAGNMEAGFLYNILKGNRLFALSLGFEVGLPVSKKEKAIDEAEIEWAPFLIAAWQIGKTQIHASFAAELTNTESALKYNLAAVVPFEDWCATLELNAKKGDSKIVYLTPGLIWKGLDDFEFALGISKNIGKNNPVAGLILMITYEFSLKKKD